MTGKEKRKLKIKTISGYCIRCGAFRETLQNDHIIPRWNGGSEKADNIQLLCANCHEDKTRREQRTGEYAEYLRDRYKDPVIYKKLTEGSREGQRLRRERDAVATGEEKARLESVETGRVAKIANAVCDHWSKYSPEDRKARNATMSAGRQRAREAYAAMMPEEQVQADRRKALRRLKSAEKQLTKLRLLAEQKKDVEALAILDAPKTVN